MRYFDGCDTPESVKSRYKGLAKRLHPDAGGDAHAFAELGRQYALALQRAGRRAGREGDYEAMGEYAAMLADFLHKAAPGLGVSVRRAAGSATGSALLGALPEEYRGLAETIIKKL